MKKITLTSIAILVFGFAAAQSVKVGLKGGINIASQNFEAKGAPSPSSITSFHVGGFVEFKLADKIALQPEVLYSVQGAAFKLDNVPVNEGFVNTSNEFSLGYINIPVMLKYYVVPKFNLEFGPQVGFLTNSKLTTTVQSVSASQSAEKIFNTVDFGLNFGAGFDITKKLMVNARYNLGLSNISKAANSPKIENSVFSLSLGFSF